MATEVRRRRGTSVEHSTFTGAIAELTVDLTKDTVVVHDGATQGGFPLLREDLSNVPTTAPFTHITLDTAIFDTAYTETESETQGTLYWNQDEETLSLVTNGETIELGQKLEVHVKNQTGSQINKGEVVYASGTVGASGRILVTKMIADGTIAAKRILGVAAENIADGADGKVVKFGKIRKVNTSAYSNGDILWVSTTAAGAFQNTEPVQADGEIALPIAFVVYSSSNNGEIFVRVTPIDENEYTNYSDYVELRSDVIENHLEIESLQDNKVEVGFLFPDGDGQALGTGDNVTFSSLTVNGNITVTGTVDGRDVAADGADLDELYTTIGLSALTASEVDQLENIGSTTISATQWGYLGVLDQNLRTTDAVTFATVDTGQGANELYAMNQDVQTTDDVTFNGLTANGAADLNSTLNVQGVLTTQDNLQDDGYSTGWSGTNWQIQADGSAEFEELRVRGALRVFEFISKQISTIGGSEILSIAQGRITSVNVGDETITVENVTGTAGNAFKANDLWICQVTDINNDLESGGTGSIVKSVRGTVVSVSGNDIVVTIDGGDISQLERGDLIVAYGNTSDSDRQAIMYRNVDRSEDNLIMRLQTQVNSFADLQAVGNTRVAFGDLNGYSGLSSETFGFFAGENANEHVLITDTGIFFKDGSTVGAQLTANEFKIGDANNNLSFNTDTGAFNIKIGDEDDLSASVAELRQDLIDIYLADQSTFAGIQFLSGQITLKVGADGKVASARLDATGDESAITLRADFFDFQSNDIVILGDPDQDAGTEAKIALGSNVDTITVANTDSGFIATGAGEFKGYIDANNYLRLNSSGLDIKSEEFKLQAGELVIDSTQDKKIKIANATEEIIAIGDFDFGAEVVDTSTASATSSSTTATITSATPTNSDTNMDTGVGTLNSNVAQDSPIVTLSRTYNVTGKWIRVQFDYQAPRYDNESLGERAVAFSITYFGEQIQELARDEFDSNTISGSVDETIFVPDTATFNTIQVQSLGSEDGLSSGQSHGKINVSNLSVTVFDDTHSYTDIGNDGFRVYNSGGNKKIEFKDGNATATLDTLSIGSWDFELASNGDLVLKYEGATVETFTKP